MPIAVPKKKRSLLPLLTVLFLFSYGLMTVLIVEQGSAIQAQRNLIKVLMRDSTELWAAKGKAIGDQQMAQAQAEAAAKARTHAPSTLEQSPSIQTPSSQAQSAQTQAPSTKAPSTQAAPQHRTQTQAGKIAKPETQLPPVPASDLVDRRRALATI
jgi:outer membrane biosynthesis protein TonB